MEKIAQELEAFGFYLSAHPLDAYSGTLEALNVVKARDLETLTAQQCASPIRMAGTVGAKRERVGKRGNKYAFVTLSDDTGSFECMMFSEVLAASRELLDSEAAVLLTLMPRSRMKSAPARQRVEDLDKALSARVRNLKVHVTPTCR